MTKEKNNNKPISLTELLPVTSHFSTIIIEFDQNSLLTHCGGLNFYENPETLSIIKTIYADQENINGLNPLIFFKSKLFLNFFYNSEALPAYS